MNWENNKEKSHQAFWKKWLLEGEGLRKAIQKNYLKKGYTKT